MAPAIDNRGEMPVRARASPSRITPPAKRRRSQAVARAWPPWREASSNRSSGLGDGFGRHMLPEAAPLDGALVRQLCPPSLIPAQAPGRWQVPGRSAAATTMPDDTAGATEMLTMRAEGNTPCNVSRIAMILCRARSCLVLEDRAAGSQASKSSYADAQQMHAKHADGPGSGMVLHG
jgi:hypothetical protein